MLRHYGLSDPYAEEWQDIDSHRPSITGSTNEPDALGTGQQVSNTLLERGVITDDSAIPASYSLSSKQFNAKDYIRDVHRRASPADLKRGQDYLNNAIESKSGSLKTLVEANYDRFVGSKRVIDNVYAQISAELLRKDKDSRLDVAKDTLNDTRARAAQIFEPAIENRKKADRLKSTLSILEQFQAHFDLPSGLLKCIEKNDNEALVKEYKRGQALFKDVIQNGNQSTPTERRNRRVLQKVWTEVDRIIRAHELDIWKLIDERPLVDIETTSKLVNVLLEIGTDTNPFARAYSQHNLHIKESAITSLETDRTHIEILRRNLELTQSSPRLQNIEALKSFVTTELSPSETEPNIVESQEVISFWDFINHLVYDVWTSQVSVAVQNWKIVQEMTDPRSTKLLPVGPDGSSRKYHKFSDEERASAIAKGEELVQFLCDSLADFFINKPITELPSIYSPLMSKSPHSPAFSDSGATPELPEMGNRQRAEFAFVPPSANSLGCSTHLGRIMSAIMDGANELHNLQISSKAIESVRLMTAAIRERMIRAICELWQTDCDDLANLEDWTKSSEDSEGTAFPKAFYVFQKAVLAGISKITFAEGSRPLPSGVMPPPSNRLMTNIRQQFVKNVYQLTNGLITLTYATDDGRDLDTKKILTLANITEFQKTSLIKLIQQFESTFKCSITDDMNKLQNMFTQYDQKLFNTYTKPRIAALEQTIRHGIEGINWLTMPLPQEIDGYIFQLVLQIVVTHAHLSKCAPSLRNRVLTFLIAHIFTTIRTIILAVKSKFGIGAMLKITLDLEFLSITFTSAYLSPESTSTMEEIFSNVESRVDRNYPTDQGSQGQPDMKKILSRGRRGISSHAKVFKSIT